MTNRTNEPTNRAEAIRQRRSEQARKRTTPAYGSRSKKSAPRTAPPVVMRGGMFGAATAPRHGKKNARRYYDVAISGTPGAEVRIPALPQIRFGWRLLTVVLVATLVYALNYVYTSPMFQVQALEVEGLQRLTVNDLAAVADIVTAPIITVDPAVVQEELARAFPELSAVDVKVSLPAKVQVKVTERQPVVAWQQDEQTLWVDAEGFAFPPRGEAGKLVTVEADNVPLGSPVVEALEGEQAPIARQLLAPEFITALMAVYPHVPEDKPVIYSVEHGLGWTDKRGWDVYFGTDVQNMEMKLNVYKAVLKRLTKEGVKPALISVEFVHAPYYRLER